MSTEEHKHFMPHLRTFQIENLPQVKISLVEKESQVEINRVSSLIDSNVLTEETFQTNQSPIVNIPFDDTQVFQGSTRISSSAANAIDYERADTAYNHEEYRTVAPIDSITEHQPATSKRANQADRYSSVRSVEHSLSPPATQLIPDSTINRKQTRKRISNATNSTHLSKFITLTPKNKTFELIADPSSSNQLRFYQIGSLFTSTSTFLMHQNEVIAHATASEPFLSDAIFIILIATLTIIILLFCLGLFCLCRRTTQRNISPSFDGGSYAPLNGQVLGRAIDDDQKRNLQYENNIPFRTDLPSLASIPSARASNDRTPPLQTIALHHIAKRQMPVTNKKLKRKRLGFCCCNSKQTPSTTVNARTRI